MELEIHDVVTDDGYNLRLQRCRYKHAPKTEVKRVILLQHGLMETSSTYALHGEHSLSFRLAREGYDVWFGNNRTNFYGQLAVGTKGDDVKLRLHDKINQDSFWNFSIDDLVNHDFPAMVNHIRNVTNADKIDFMGASQGAGQAMGAICERPEMKNMFNTMILCCPAMFIKKDPEEFLLQMLCNVPMSWWGAREFMSIISVFQLFLPLPWLKGNIGFGFMKLMGFIKRPLGDNGSTKTRARWFSFIPMSDLGQKSRPLDAGNETRRRLDQIWIHGIVSLRASVEQMDPRCKEWTTSSQCFGLVGR
jgi:pimeloyl-ACP methyl ester carboxylesterase